MSNVPKENETKCEYNFIIYSGFSWTYNYNKMTSIFPNKCICLILIWLHFMNGQVLCNEDYSISKSETRIEKMTHLHFFFQDVVSGKRATAIQIAGPNTPYPNGFGVMNMADDRLTIRADRRSEVIGRAQGLYGLASKEELSLLMVMNYVFTKGRYNGSSITIVGRNPPMQDVREMPVIGGTGLFRLARGYALAHTVWSNPQGDATVEYHVYVNHY